LHQQTQIDLTETFLSLREQRMGMIQSPEQLAFVYATLEDYLHTKFPQPAASKDHHPSVGLMHHSASSTTFGTSPKKLMFNDKDLSTQLEKMMRKRTLSLGDEMDKFMTKPQSNSTLTEPESNNSKEEKPL
jgi:hypothetical protein